MQEHRRHSAVLGEREAEQDREPERERETGKGRYSPQSSPPASADMQTGISHQGRGAGRRGGGGARWRESPLTRFRGLWSIKGLRRNSKTTPTISTSVVRTQVPVGYKCVVMCIGCVSSFLFCPMCKACVEFCASPVAASEQEPQNLACSLVLFLR